MRVRSMRVLTSTEQIEKGEQKIQRRVEIQKALDIKVTHFELFDAFFQIFLI